MDTKKLLPAPRYRVKMFMVGALAYVIPAIGILIFTLAVMSAKGVDLSGRPATTFFAVFALCSVVAWILLATLIPPYFRAISYELTDSEIVVRKGIVTKVVKTIPYRTVTNIVESRDLLDRYAVNLGSIRIQTAGKSGETGYEASLAGLSDWEEAHQTILARLRGFQGGMKATAAEMEEDSAGSGLLREILAELKAIRISLAEKY